METKFDYTAENKNDNKLYFKPKRILDRSKTKERKNY